MQKLPNGRARKSISISSIAQEIEQLEKYNYQEPNLERAVRYKDLNSLRRRIVGSTQFVQYPLCAKLKEIGKFSPGIQLYFQRLRNTIIVFFILSFISIPLLYINLIGNGLSPEQIKSSIQLTTIANSQYQNITTNTTNNTTNTINNEYTNQLNDELNQKKQIYTYLDFTYCIIFWGYMIYSRIKLSKDSDILDQDNISPRDYTIEISDLPPSGYSQEQIISYFKKHKLNVAEVNFARNFNGCLRLLQEIFKLESKKSGIEADALLKPQANYETKLQKLSELIEQKRVELWTKLSEGEEETYFKEQTSDLPILQQYNKCVNDESKCKQLMRYCCCLKRKGLPDNMLFLGKYNVQLKQPDEPSNIKWENLDITPQQRFKKSLVVYSVVLLILIFNLIIIIIGNGLTIKGDEQCDQQIEQITVDFLKTLNDDQKSCYCSKIDALAVIQDSEIRSICNIHAAKKYLSGSINFGLSFIIIGINLLLKWVLKKLAKFQHFQTETQKIISSNKKIFISMFINTAIVPLIANSAIFNFKLSENIYSIVGPYLPSAFNTEFQTENIFYTNWYGNVGTKIVISMIINIISPHAIYALTVPIRSKFKISKIKNFKYQKQFNEFLLDPTFDLASKSAFAINTIFVCLLYSGGMPILLFCGSFALLFMYWSDKYVLLRYSKKPHMLDENLIQSILQTLPLCLIFHLIASIYAYGVPGILESGTDSELTDYLLQYETSTDSLTWFTEFIRRLKKTPHLSALLVLIILYQVLDLLFLRFIQICFQKQNQVQPEDKEELFGTYQQEYDRLMWQGVPSYNIKLNPAYKPYIQVIDSSDDEEQQQQHQKNPILHKKQINSFRTHKTNSSIDSNTSLLPKGGGSSSPLNTKRISNTNKIYPVSTEQTPPPIKSNSLKKIMKQFNNDKPEPIISLKNSQNQISSTEIQLIGNKKSSLQGSSPALPRKQFTPSTFIKKPK